MMQLQSDFASNGRRHSADRLAACIENVAALTLPRAAWCFPAKVRGSLLTSCFDWTDISTFIPFKIFFANKISGPYNFICIHTFLSTPHIISHDLVFVSQRFSVIFFLNLFQSDWRELTGCS
jgi:hypothetical protein